MTKLTCFYNRVKEQERKERKHQQLSKGRKLQRSQKLKDASTLGKEKIYI